MPYVKLPTNEDDLGNNSVEGGLIVPLAISLAKGYDLVLMTQLDVLKDADDHGYHPSFFNTATIGVEFTEHLGMYYEIATTKGTDTGDRWLVQLDTGVTYTIGDNIQLDAGINFGATKAAPDFNPFVGITYRY